MRSMLGTMALVALCVPACRRESEHNSWASWSPEAQAASKQHNVDVIRGSTADTWLPHYTATNAAGKVQSSKPLVACSWNGVSYSTDASVAGFPKSYPGIEIRGIGCPITRSIVRTIEISSGDINVNASPDAAARPVLPMRWT